ncbi:carbohydrate sulfotransferase 1-like protein [Leptotrombidium deliense]|uniref:Carbohydrate sulfotransferase 1-like protein n=1 Tax=Leptotrombidium deliense TaxID=299467 RepID=A0A443RZT3_9ACAR|nr:carbohydrate sulfotransferase 1-like protein [Leptotrombidium deliense]
MQHVDKFLNITNERVKVVYLIRDPRAIYTSRKSRSWCSKSSCSDIDILCKQIEDDLVVYRELKQRFPERVFLIRYEDLSMYAMETTKLLFQKLMIPFSESVSRYLITHTIVPKAVHEDPNPYSTRRNSRIMPFQWTHSAKFQEIRKDNRQASESE